MENNTEIVRVSKMENLEELSEILLQFYARFNDNRVFTPDREKMHNLYKEVSKWLKDVKFELNAINMGLIYTKTMKRSLNDIKILEKYKLDLLVLKCWIADELLLEL